MKLETNDISLALGSSAVDKAYLGTELVYEVNPLPAGYTMLSYIESTGTQFINTGVAYGLDKQVEIRFGATTSTFSRFGFVIGGGGNFQGLVTRNSSNSYYASLNSSSTGAVVFSISDSIFNWTFNTSEHKVLKNGVAQRTLTPIDPYTASGNIGILGNPQAANYNNVGIGRIYRAVVKDNQTNKALFKGIPAMRDSDSAVGMYDLISDTFLTNAGSGDFTYGNDV